MKASEVAHKYLGQQEKPSNAGFKDEDFERRMRDVGFETGHAWCSYFAELVFKEAFPEKFNELDKLFSGSTQETFRNFARASYPISLIPQINNLVIWQRYVNGKGLPTGHCGIVSEVKSTWEFKSIEGNTNDEGSREGYTVAEHDRKVLVEVKNGLKVLGFIHINGPTTLTV